MDYNHVTGDSQVRVGGIVYSARKGQTGYCTPGHISYIISVQLPSTDGSKPIRPLTRGIPTANTIQAP